METAILLGTVILVSVLAIPLLRAKPATIAEP
jgi:hypothetical protein